MTTQTLTPEEKQALLDKYLKPLKKRVESAIMAGILTFFSLMILLLILDTIGLEYDNQASKMTLVSLSVVASLVYFTRSTARNLKAQKQIDQATVEEYTFQVEEYIKENVSNTEWTAYLCFGEKGPSVYFLTDQYFKGGLRKEIHIRVLQLKFKAGEEVLLVKHNPNAEKAKQLKSKTIPEEYIDFDFTMIEDSSS
ncbi:MAG TPA: hypothetical protein DCE41_36435 [Cytophagales bacterium]|nr:hypothetical protein [Cytophagales bacterium]HAA17288.1 hypothetical protein [Cytophagales bacterium]HAP59915.1 hypothetical protein [Cytophagales bacterium]